MGKIKSALELAMERTSDVVVDKAGLVRDDMLRTGKVAAGRYLSDPSSVSLAKELESLDADKKSWAWEGVVETLLSNLTLPRFESDIKTLSVLSEAFNQVCREKGTDCQTLETLFHQYAELFENYLETLNKLEDQLREHWEPRLRQKEQALMQQTGQQVKLSAEQDPEFTKTLSDEMARLDEQYNGILDQGKQEIRKII